MLSWTAFAQETETTADDMTIPEDIDVDSMLDSFSSLDSVNQFGGKLGYNFLGGEHYATLRLTPEINLGKWGVGLDVPLSVNLQNGKVRTEEYVRGVGALRMVRYLRYGRKKRDPIHVKVGDMTGSYIGFGLLMDNYSNATSFERRKVGITWDLLFDKRFGIEGLYNDLNLTSMNLLAVRPYVKPFGKTLIPIVRSIEIGGTYIMDRDQTTQEGLDLQQNLLIRNGGITAYGADFGATLLDLGFIRVTASAQYGNINKTVTTSDLTAYYQEEFRAENAAKPIDEQLTGEELEAEVLAISAGEEEGFQTGDGYAFGLQARASILFKLLTMQAKLERVKYNAHFIPNFFDIMYELNKDQRLLTLMNTAPTFGIYGDLSATILGSIRVNGGLMMPDNITESTPAMVKAGVDVVNVLDKIDLHAQYIKGGLTDWSDAFTLDNNSLAYIRASYKAYKFLTVGVDYQWTWQKGAEGAFAPKHTVMPFFGFNVPLIGKKDKEVEED
ncbi:hypothetical protein GCM10023331_23060 [Algivirga pacifica]|uniref:DUF5723 domain-containing protein n=2 Tax=Algivirga pacifica TaxID=1162670 RepID=A0ABP9DC01_9BACT